VNEGKDVVKMKMVLGPEMWVIVVQGEVEKAAVNSSSNAR
jgi:hypothetical protein